MGFEGYGCQIRANQYEIILLVAHMSKTVSRSGTDQILHKKPPCACAVVIGDDSRVPSAAVMNDLTYVLVLLTTFDVTMNE